MTNIVAPIKKWLEIILYAAIIGEIIFFPSWANLCGCLMALVSWYIFKFFFKISVLTKYPFAFMMYLSMFIYRYLPPIATLLEQKPVTYGFQNPYDTFFFETLLFVTSSLAFYFATNHCLRNNIVQRILYRAGFFASYQPFILWELGGVGIFAQLFLNLYGNVEYGDIGGKFLQGIVYLKFTPLCLFFPDLYTNQQSAANLKNWKLWSYFSFLFISSFSSNSREAMLAPLATFLLLYFLHICKKRSGLHKLFSPGKIIFSVIFGYCLIQTLSDLSIAMVYNRGIRQEVSKKELLYATLQTYQDKELISELKKRANNLDNKKTLSYTEGWDETYLDNFMLNRYCNIRISDQTLYHAFKCNFNNSKMLSDFITKSLSILPTPWLRFLGINTNKQDISYSRGDILYAESIRSGIYPGYRVTSHIADGLVTFGYFYFIIQFILLWAVFKLLNSLVLYTSKGYVYSIYGLISVFTFLGMSRNANGCLNEINYCLRGFWQGCFTFGILLFLIRKTYQIFTHKS